MSDGLLSLTDLKNKVLDGEPVTAEEYNKVIANIRRDRTAASSRAKTSGGAKGKSRAMSDEEIDKLF